MASQATPASSDEASPELAQRAAEQGQTATSSSSSSTIRSDTVPSTDTETAELQHDTPTPGGPSPSSSSAQTSRATAARPSIVQRTSTSTEARKCWICLADETEDGPGSSAWKTPCQCALTAHEACLLDWVAELEAPAQGLRAARKIECPQCKGEIRIARPFSPVAEGVRRIDRVLTRLTVPGIALTVLGSLTAGAWVHGLASIYVVFGPEDFARLFGMQHAERRVNLGSALAAVMVPFTLVACRTNLADNALPIFPVFFFATQYHPDRRRGAAFWPPSPAMAFVCLPYLRGIYNLAWHHVFAARERQWISEVTPPRAEPGGIRLEWAVRPRARDRAADRADADNNNAPAAAADDDDDDEEEEEVEIEAEVVPAAAAAPPAQANNGGGDAPAAAAAPAGAPAAAAAGAGNGAGALENANQIIDTGGRIADAIMGALCFPLVAAAAGELLRLTLPVRWVVPAGASSGAAAAGLYTGFNRRASPAVTGLLQARWGRSIVGGCLFVLLKDTLRLYARYRAAVSQRSRHVLDYAGKGGKGRARKARKSPAAAAS